MLESDDIEKFGEDNYKIKGKINIENLRQGTIIATELESRDEYVINKESTYVKLEYKDSVKIELENGNVIEEQIKNGSN